MSAAASTAFEVVPQRGFPRHPINVPLDLIALRSGVPDNLPGRCTDISEAGVGAIVAGELTVGQQVAIELRLPNVGVPVRTRASVRYQSRLRCGLQFSGLSMEQREMIRYWVYRCAQENTHATGERSSHRVELDEPAHAIAAAVVLPQKRRIRIGRRGSRVLSVCVLVLAALGWWQWQTSWSELESSAEASESRLHVSPETMEKRIVTKVDPVYPEAARKSGTEGLVVLNAIIAPDGSVTRLRRVSGPALLVQAATKAVESWKFEPYLSSGKPVEVETTIAVEFRMN